MFDIGDEVICVDDSQQNHNGLAYIVKGQKYIIRWIGPFWHPQTGRHLCVRVEGIIRDTTNEVVEFIPVFDLLMGPEWRDMPFRADRFRKINKKTTDITVFTEMLTPKDVKEDA